MTSPESAPHVAELRQFLLTHTPIDEQERASITEFIGHLDTLPEPLSEDAAIIHVTSSAMVVGVRGVLLHRHKRLGIWIQPGGHIDPDERPEDAAIREVFEETGLITTHADTPRIIHVDVHAAPKGHRHLDLRYLLLGPDEEPRPPEGESQDVRWLSLDEAAVMAAPGLTGLLAATRRASGPYLA